MREPSYEHGQFCWVDLVAHDMHEAISFYSKMFDWDAEHQDTAGGPPYAMFFRDGEVVAGIGQMNDSMIQSGVPPMWNSYIHVDDIAEVVEETKRLDGSVVFGPDQVLDAGWMAYIQDPSGATVGLWQDGNHHGAERVSKTGSFCWNELNTRESEQARKFFGELFEWQYEHNGASPSEYYIIKNRDRHNGGILTMTDEWGDMPPHWMVYFVVENVAKETERLQKLGGTLHFGPFDTAAGPMSVVADPQGGTFHLIALQNRAVDTE